MNNLNVKLNIKSIKQLNNNYPISYGGQVVVSKGNLKVTFACKISHVSLNKSILNEVFYFKNGKWLTYQFKNKKVIDMIEKEFNHHIKKFGLLYNKVVNDKKVMVDCAILQRAVNNKHHEIYIDGKVFKSYDLNNLTDGKNYTYYDINTNIEYKISKNDIDENVKNKLLSLFSQVKTRHEKIIKRNKVKYKGVILP